MRVDEDPRRRPSPAPRFRGRSHPGGPGFRRSGPGAPGLVPSAPGFLRADRPGGSRAGWEPAGDRLSRSGGGDDPARERHVSAPQHAQRLDRRAEDPLCLGPARRGRARRRLCDRRPRCRLGGRRHDRRGDAHAGLVPPRPRRSAGRRADDSRRPALSPAADRRRRAVREGEPQRGPQRVRGRRSRRMLDLPAHRPRPSARALRLPALLHGRHRRARSPRLGRPSQPLRGHQVRPGPRRARRALLDGLARHARRAEHDRRLCPRHRLRTRRADGLGAALSRPGRPGLRRPLRRPHPQQPRRRDPAWEGVCTRLPPRGGCRGAGTSRPADRRRASSSIRRSTSPAATSLASTRSIRAPSRSRRSRSTLRSRCWRFPRSR
jgi:hypothetical protein